MTETDHARLYAREHAETITAKPLDDLLRGEITRKDFARLIADELRGAWLEGAAHAWAEGNAHLAGIARMRDRNVGDP